MGEAQNESQNCFLDRIYSAKLLWKVLLQTKVIVSVIKAEKGVRRRVSVRTKTRRTREWMDNNPNEKSHWEEKKSKRTGVKKSCYLCKIHQNNLSKSTLDLPYSYAPQTLKSPFSQGTITYLPITRSQPPAPPRRSTSLPYYKILKRLKRLQVVTGPHCYLGDFRLDVEDGWVWRDVVGNFGGGDIWELALRVCHKDAGIRRLVLAVGYWSYGQEYGLGRISCHCLKAMRHLKRHFSWEFSFLSTYLFTYLNTLLGNKKMVRYWMRTGYRILRRACQEFKVDVEGDGKGLPGSMREVAVAFGRLHLR